MNMNSIELIHTLTNDKFAKDYFLGVFSSDHVPLSIRKVPACFIANTDPSWKPGGHWLAVFVDHENNVEFFDSYGQDPTEYPMISAFLRKYEDTCKRNTVQLQSYFSSTCGQFCLYFILWRCRGVTFENIMSAFDECKETNDFLVTTFVNGLFDKNTKVYDVDYVTNQCCRAKSCSFTDHF